jgi:hypothetical protein
MSSFDSLPRYAIERRQILEVAQFISSGLVHEIGAFGQHGTLRRRSFVLFCFDYFYFSHFNFSAGR